MSGMREEGRYEGRGQDRVIYSHFTLLGKINLNSTFPDMASFLWKTADELLNVTFKLLTLITFILYQGSLLQNTQTYKFEFLNNSEA